MQRTHISDPPIESDYQSLIDVIIKLVPYHVAERVDPNRPAQEPFGTDRGTRRLLRWRAVARFHGANALLAAGLIPFLSPASFLVGAFLLSPLASVITLLTSLQAVWLGPFGMVNSRVHHFVGRGGLLASLAGIAVPWLVVMTWRWLRRGEDLPMWAMVGAIAVQGGLALYQGHALTKGAKRHEINLITWRSHDELAAIRRAEEDAEAQTGSAAPAGG